MNTPALPPGNPPDYISIPEHLRTRPFAEVGDSHLRRLLLQANIRLLGNLHGRRLSELEAYPGCGERTVWDLRDRVIRAVYPGAEPDLETWPIPMRFYRPNPSLAVSAAIGHLKLQDLPVSTRLELVLKGLGIERLGHLNGVPVRELLRTRNCGAKTLAELKTLLRRAEAGEFTFSQRELATKVPADLLRLIDDLTSRLPKRQRAFLALHFGAAGKAPRSFDQIGRQQLGDLFVPATAQQFGRGIDTAMPTSYVTLASQYLRNMHQLGVHAGQSLNRTVRDKLFNCYVAGNTVVFKPTSKAPHLSSNVRRSRLLQTTPS